ncbi:MAG: T9SS type A sorting domain-containing protein, partial [Rhodothermales bacterium]|nr:T9SS type A sorting domain-containing protein [Rhodothermales bacterium]
FYYALQGLLRDGSPERVGGDYWDDRDPAKPETRFCFSGDPVRSEYWSAENTNGTGTRMAPHDVRYQMNLGPFTLRAGEPQEVAFAVLWTRGSDRLDSVSRLRAAASHVRSVAPALLAPSVQPGDPAPEGPDPPLGLSQTYPNPAADETVFQFSLPMEATVRLEIVDLMGRTVLVVQDGRLAAGPYRVPVDVSRLSPGVFFYRFHLDHRVFTRRMVVAR